jgi:PAS domain S-box-containing protein
MNDKAKKKFSNTNETEENRQHLPSKVSNCVYEISYLGDQFLSVDDHICNSLGFSRDELLSMNPLELLDDESMYTFFDILLMKELHKSYDHSAKFRAKAKDGSVKTFMVNLIEFKYTDGNPSSAVVLANDVTEEEELS